jgi:uncharacterized membrane protein
MKNWISEHPYFCTSIIFLIIMVVGWQVLYWSGENFMFLLLLYFIVTLGIRLDDISRKIGSGVSRAESGFKEQESIIGQLHDIKITLLRLNTTLNKILTAADNSEDSESIK